MYIVLPYMYMYMLGCAVLLCLVVFLTVLASFFLPSHLSLKHVCDHAVLLALFVCLTVLASSFLPSHLSLKHMYTCTVYISLSLPSFS